MIDGVDEASDVVSANDVRATAVLPYEVLIQTLASTNHSPPDVNWFARLLRNV